MKDPTAPDSKYRKKFMFYDTEQRQAQLRIRCKYDGLNQSQFFRIMITGYLDGDSNIAAYLDSYKEEHSMQGKLKRAYIKKMHAAAGETKNNFSTAEIENIFDILEKEE